MVKPTPSTEHDVPWPAGPWAWSSWHVAGQPEVRVADGWTLCTMPADDYARAVSKFPDMADYIRARARSGDPDAVGLWRRIAGELAP